MLTRVLARNSMVAPRAAANFSTWGHVDMAPADPILGLNEAFKTDANPKKILLGMGAYRDDNGKPYILPCVRRAEEIILEKNMDHEYSGIQGIDSYVAKALTLAYGEDSKPRQEGRIAAAQSISGTGSLRLGFEFMSAWYPHKDIDVYVPAPTWPLHRGLAEKVGYNWKEYRYFHKETKGLDFDGLVDDLHKAKDHSIILMHVCAHNPTGVDPTKEQWQKILEVCLAKKHFVGFDSAYQGFASGDLETDAYSLRLFQEHSDRLLLFQSFAKNFGLYGERAGCFSVVCNNPDEKNKVMSRIKQLARPLYSNPPIHGARIVDIILGDKDLTASWHNDLKIMSARMAEMRSALRTGLSDRGSEHDWSHVTSQIGMFAYTGLNKD